MKTQKPANQIISALLLCALSSSAATAQVSESTTPLKTQKYNGYGLPNTKFKKIKVDMTKKATSNQTTATTAPSIDAAPVSLVPKSSMQPNNTIVATAKPTADTKLVSFNFDYDLSYNAQMQEQENHARGEYLQHEFTPQLKIGDYTVLGDFFYYDDLKSPSANEWMDSVIAAKRKPWEMGSYLTLGPGFILGLPLSKASREDAGIKYLVGPTLTLGINSKNIGLEALTLNYYVRYAKYATEFKTKPNGDPSADYLIRQRINIGWQFTDKLSFKGRFEYNSGYSNQGVVKNAYVHFENFTYQITDMVGVYIAHSTGGNVYSITENAAGDITFENDLKFYDPKVSEIALGTTLSF